MALGDFNDLAACFKEQVLTIRVGRQRRAVARQRQTQRLGQTVHRVRSEHTRARPAGRAGVFFDMLDLLVGVFVIRRGNHRVDKVDLLGVQIGNIDLARFHRATGHEDHRDVQAHGGHQHAGGDLVTVRDTDHRVGAVGVDHVLDRIRNHFARGQRIQHPVMAHRNPVINGDGVEFLGDAACGLNLAGDHLAQIFQVDVTRHELRKAVHDGDDRLAEIAVGHAGCAPKATGTSHVAAMCRSSGSVSRHAVPILI